MNSAAADFYVIGGTLQRDAPSYIKRRADEELYEGLNAGRFCYVLTSRQMGKSSLMVRTAVRLRADGVAVAVLDLTAIGQHVTVEQWYEGLLNLVGQQLDLEDELEDFWAGHKHVGPLQRWMRAIREVAMERVRASLVIFVDEIDAVNSLSFSTDEFFAGIRECYNRRTRDPEFSRLTFCLLGVATPSDLIRDVSTTPFNIGQRIELSDFTERESAPLAEGLRRPAQMAHALINRILYWTGGHPYLTQRLCQAVADNDDVDGKGGVDRLCEEMFLSPRARERDDNLLFVRERMLRSPVDRAALLELYLKAREAKRVKDDEGNPLASVLRLSGITRAVEGYLLVRNRIYYRVFDRAWVVANMPDAEVRRQRAAYRRGVLRAASVAAVVLLGFGILTAVAVGQKRYAEQQRTLAVQERQRADENAARLEETLLELRAALRDTEEQKRIAEDQRRIAEDKKQQALASSKRAEAKSREAEEQRRIAVEQKAEAERQRALAVEQTKLAEARLAEVGATREQAKQERTRAEAEARQRFQLLYDVDMNLAQQAWERADIPHLLELLKKQLPAQAGENVAEDRREFEWFFHSRRAHADLMTLSLAEQKDPVSSVAFSNDGALLAAGNYDGTVKLWDAASGNLRLTVGGNEDPSLGRHEGTVNAVAFSNDGALLVTASGDKTAKLWDAKTGRVVRTFKRSKADPTAQEDAAPASHEDVVSSVAFSNDGRRVATASFDKTARLWDAASGDELFTLEGHGDAIWSVTFSPDGKWVATASVDNTVKLWDAANGKVLSTFNHASPVMSVAVSPDGASLATGSFDGTVKLWEVTTFKESSALGGHRVRFKELSTLRGHTSPVMSVALSPDGKRVASASRDRTIKLWDAATTRELLTYKGHAGSVISVAFSPDGRRLASGGYDSTVKLWDATLDHDVVTLVHPQPVSSVAFSNDGKWLATGCGDKNARLWDAARGKEVRAPLGHAEAVTSVAFMGDGTRLLTGSADRTVRAWDLTNGQPTNALAGYQGRVTVAVASDDGKWLATGSEGGEVAVWDAASGGQVFLRQEHTQPVASLAFSPDGKWLASGGRDGLVKLWDVANVQARNLRERDGDITSHTAYVTSVAFSKDGKWLASGSGDKTAKLWDVTSGRVVSTLTGHGDVVTSVAFSPGGARLATGSEDYTVKLWDTGTGREVLTLAHRSIVTSVAFSPDGRRLASGSGDNTVKLWDATDLDETRKDGRPANAATAANTSKR